MNRRQEPMRNPATSSVTATLPIARQQGRLVEGDVEDAASDGEKTSDLLVPICH